MRVWTPNVDDWLPVLAHDSDEEEIVCRVARGRGRRGDVNVPRLPQAALLERSLRLQEDRTGGGMRRGRGRARSLRLNVDSSRPGKTQVLQSDRYVPAHTITDEAESLSLVSGEDFPPLASETNSSTKVATNKPSKRRERRTIRDVINQGETSPDFIDKLLLEKRLHKEFKDKKQNLAEENQPFYEKYEVTLEDVRQAANERMLQNNTNDTSVNSTREVTGDLLDNCGDMKTKQENSLNVEQLESDIERNDDNVIMGSDIADIEDHTIDTQVRIETGCDITDSEDKVAGNEGHIFGSHGHSACNDGQITDTEGHIADTKGHIVDTADIEGNIPGAQCDISDIEGHIAGTDGLIADTEGHISDTADTEGDVGGTECNFPGSERHMAGTEVSTACGEGHIKDVAGHIVGSRVDISDLQIDNEEDIAGSTVINDGNPASDNAGDDTLYAYSATSASQLDDFGNNYKLLPPLPPSPVPSSSSSSSSQDEDTGQYISSGKFSVLLNLGENDRLSGSRQQKVTQQDKGLHNAHHHNTKQQHTTTTHSAQNVRHSGKGKKNNVQHFSAKKERNVGATGMGKNRKVRHTAVGAGEWRIAGDQVVQVDGMPADCDTSGLQEFVASFGSVLDYEVMRQATSTAIRFRLNSKDACVYTIQCLHGTDTLYPDSTNTLTVYQVSEIVPTPLLPTKSAR